MTKESIKALFKDVLKNGVTTNNYREIEKAIFDIDQEIRRTENKKNGKINQARAAELVIKSAKKTAIRALHGAWIAKDGFQYVCDSKMLIRFKNHIALEHIPEDTTPFQIEKSYGVASGDQVCLPPISEITTAIKEKKAEAKIKKIKNPRICCKLENGMIINAEYLKIAIMATGAETGETPTKTTKNGIISPLYVHGNEIDSMVLPICCENPESEKYFIY